jgi:hypothetical protein
LNPRCLKLFKKAKANPCGLSFSQFQRLCAGIGMILDRKESSHFIYKLGEPFFLLSIQKTKDGKAKAYQVRQLMNFIEENNLDQKD